MFQTNQMQQAALADQVQKTCEAAILKRLKIARLRDVITVEHVRGSDEHTYSDYLNITDRNALESAEELGAGIAVLYNAVVTDAVQVTRYKVVSDLFLNNLKINFVINDQPSVSDPAGIIPGWISFKFFFRSSNELPANTSLNGHQETLAKAKAQQGY